VFTRVTVSRQQPAKQLVTHPGITTAYLVIRNAGPSNLFIGQNGNLTTSTPGVYQLLVNQAVWGTFNINNIFVTTDGDEASADVAVSDPAGLLP
jgi:hypothetical protein